MREAVEDTETKRGVPEYLAKKCQFMSRRDKQKVIIMQPPPKPMRAFNKDAVGNGVAWAVDSDHIH